MTMSRWSSGNLSALYRARVRKHCSKPKTVHHCHRIWQQALEGEGLHLGYANCRFGDRRERCQASPGFAASIALHSTVHVLKNWLGGVHMENWVFQQAADFLRLYRTLAPRIPPRDLTQLRIADLDEAISRFMQSSYNAALQIALRERFENKPPGEAEESFDSCFLRAFTEVVEALLRAHVVGFVVLVPHVHPQKALTSTSQALDAVQVDYVPCQGTLIALLRYGTFPTGRLTDGKQDVVDNDAEFMVFAEPGFDLLALHTRISVALEAAGWPPCTIEHQAKLVCLSLHLEIPLKLELYLFIKDVEKGVINKDIECHPSAKSCEPPMAYPLQAWGGQMPLQIVTLSAQLIRALMALGLVPEDLRLLRGYARGLHRGGYASLLEDLDGRPCQERQQRIMLGETHASFPKPEDGRISKASTVKWKPKA
eukprot:g20270.t1